MTYREPAIAAAVPPEQPRFVAGAGQLFPRQHPSAELCLALVVLSAFGLGPAAGIPAVLLARLVLRETAEAPRLYMGRSKALAALVGAWAGTLFWSGVWLLLLGRAYVPIAYVAVTAGAVLGGLGVPSLLIKVRSSRRAADARYAVVVLSASALTLLAGGAAGAVWHAADARAAAAECEDLRRSASEATAAARFEEARKHLQKAENVCEGASLAIARTMAARIPQLEEDQRKREATHQFERARTVAATVLTEARSLAGSKKFEDAEAKLRKAAEQLDEFRKWPHIADSLEWKQAVKHIRDERDRISPDVDAALRGRVTSLLAQGRRLASERKWDLALKTLADADALRKGWQPLSATTGDWRKLESDLLKERERTDAGAETARRQREAAAEAAQKRDEAKQRAAEAAESAKEATRRVSCCDGTLSPSCMCSAASHRGCCSHHGGMCGCE